MRESLDWVLRYLRSIPGVSAVSGRLAEVVLVRRGESVPFRIVSIPRVPRGDRERIVEGLSRGTDLLATSRLNSELRSELSRAGISWIEKENGLVHIDAPGLLIHWSVPVELIARPTEPPVSLGGIASLVGELILAEYSNRDFTLGELAARVPVTKARVSQILSTLVATGWVHAEGRTRSRDYRVRDPASLLAAWAEQAAVPDYEAGAYRWVRTVESLYPRLTFLDDLQVRWAVGGVAAAHIYEPTLSAAPVPTVWIEASASLAEVASVLEAEIVEPGDPPNLVFWQGERDLALQAADTREAAWCGEVPLNVVSLPRAYAESRRAGGRGLDAAEALYDLIVP